MPIGSELKNLQKTKRFYSKKRLLNLALLVHLLWQMQFFLRKFVV